MKNSDITYAVSSSKMFKYFPVSKYIQTVP